MREIAYGKINLGLSVLDKRPDGYHAVDMVMQSISFADAIDISEAEEFRLTCDNPVLPCDSRNLAYKAAEIMSKATGKALRLHIHITKRIFQAAGLAGGSTDGAAVLRGLNKFWQTKLSVTELEKLAEQLGSDVPFCVQGGTVRATGRGEVLEPLADVPELHLVLAKPRNLKVSTAWVYKNFQRDRVVKPVDQEVLVKALQARDRQGVLAAMGNDLETVTLPCYPMLKKIKKAMLENGAEQTLMSGSGPTIFGIVPDAATAQKLGDVLQEAYPVEIARAVTAKGGNV